MPNKFAVVLADADGRRGRMEFNIGPVTLPPALVTAADATIATMGGQTNAFLTNAIPVHWEFIITNTDLLTLPTIGDIRNTWGVRVRDNTTQEITTFSIPGRNTLNVMTTGISKGEFIDLANPAWVAFVAAVQAGGLDIRSPEGNVAVLDGARAQTTRRVAPRI